MSDDTNPFPPPDILDFIQDFGLANPSLTLELERLQEGTIFSLLNDFGVDYSETPNGALTSDFVESNKSPEDDDADNEVGTMNSFLRSLSSSEPGNALPENVKAHSSGNVKITSSCVFTEHAPQGSAAADNERYLWSCVEHDHSYCVPCVGTIQKEGHLMDGVPAAAEMDTSTEEENSDTGYETTSPVVVNMAVATPNATPSSSSLPTAVIQAHGQYHDDPVALIDSRIKHFVDSQQVCLTEEEKETLRAEGMPIPTTLPLTKAEEKALKAVRRKLRNKMAAHESRKKKKEYVYALEDRVRQCTTENLRLQKKLESLESENRSLASQLKKLQSLMAKGALTAVTNHKGAVLTVLVLCFAILFGSCAPMKSSWGRSDDYTTTTVRSRVLLSVDSPQAFHNSNWFWYYLFWEEPSHLCRNDPKLPQYGCYSHASLDLYAALMPDGSTDIANDTHTTALSPTA